MNSREWNCKCKCKSKKAHGARWMFISFYKKNIKAKEKSNKLKNCLIANPDFESGLVVIDESNKLDDMESNDIIVPKVKYDSVYNKIVVISNDDCNHRTNDLDPIQDNLVELRDLINI